MTSAYLRARDAVPKSSYRDFAAVSHPVDEELAEVLAHVVCDGIIAPGHAPGRLGRKNCNAPRRTGSATGRSGPADHL
ncbi:hypothetical protein [Streptomyces sp. NRRL S-646]|uniref:hypothetical protein n=1 Tax=Streptomyces sp. NRRL S-646 TaxID=1463917 RepID=UPI003B63AD53